MRFSARFEASKGKRVQVLEDAPRATRIGFLKRILIKFVGTEGGFRNTRKQPLDTSEVHESFVALIRDEADPWDYDNEGPWSALSQHLKDCTWGEFYDFVELLGKLLLKKEADGPFDDPDHFKEYQTQVNELFREDSIGWTLNEASQLYRQIPKELVKRIEVTASMLAKRFDTARQHYQKAQSYLHQHPIDEANSIKEIVSAIESVARTVNPKASTLG
ncbi:MAG: AbiJ-NTD4 domain-containing protein [Hydrogenophaga sp.]